MDVNVETKAPSAFRAPLVALAIAVLCWSAAGAANASAPEKVFLHVTRTEIVAGGHAFGSAGAYQKIAGTVEFQLDPADPRNAGIVDVDLAPRNQAGLVTFDADFMVLRPADMSRWNNQLVSEINNRGNLLLFLSFASAGFNNDPSSVADFGNGFFLNQGYALAWVGWGADVLPGVGALRCGCRRRLIPMAARSRSGSR